MNGMGLLDKLLNDESITEVMVNGPTRIYYEQKGRLAAAEGIEFKDEQEVYGIIEAILKPLGRELSREAPYIDARLEDGSRVNIVVPPVSLTGPMITIRKFARSLLTGEGLVERGALSRNMLAFLALCVEEKRNIVISGGTGSGKTTLLNAVSNFVFPGERIITIEDTAELHLGQEHVGRLEARGTEKDGREAVSIRQLVINALRMRPDRIIVGECRSGEALDMLQAMNTGHAGSLTTVHANSPRDCLKRLEVMVMMAGYDLPVRAIREQISSAVNIIVQVSRMGDGRRKVTDISEINGMEGDVITLAPVFQYKQSRTDIATGMISGEFTATGNIPAFIESVRARGRQVSQELFT